MRQLYELSYAEVVAIDAKSAIAAIEEAIRNELKTRSARNLLDDGWGDHLRARVGDVRIFFHPNVPTKAVDTLYDGIEGIAEMTDADADRAHWKALERDVLARIDQGLGQYIWQDLMDQAARREAARSRGRAPARPSSEPPHRRGGFEEGWPSEHQGERQ